MGRWVPVTADDVVFTWDAMTDPENGTWFDGVDYTDSIEKVDDHTVVVHYNTVYPNYLVHFGGEDFVIWPAHYCDADQGFFVLGLQPGTTQQWSFPS